MQNFWVEAIKKEASLRLEWQLKYSKNFAKTALKQKAIKDRAMALNSNISKHIKQMEKELNADKQPEEKPKSDEESDYFPIIDMRPASPRTRSQLYEGISHHGEGRYAYLKQRNYKSPEEKYIFPILSSCEYGWKILDHGFPKCSPYARTRVIRDTFYRQSGIIHG